MFEYLGKHSCMSSSFPVAMLNGTYPKATVHALQVHYVFGAKR